MVVVITKQERVIGWCKARVKELTYSAQGKQMKPDNPKDNQKEASGYKGF